MDEYYYIITVANPYGYYEELTLEELNWIIIDELEDKYNLICREIDVPDDAIG